MIVGSSMKHMIKLETYSQSTTIQSGEDALFV
jgi:hypothetical protein